MSRMREDDLLRYHRYVSLKIQYEGDKGFG